MKKGIVQKILNALKREKLDIAQLDKTDANQQFVIPGDEALVAMDNHEQLSYAQIVEVVNYIRINYHLVSDNDALYNFTFNWLRCNGDVAEINEYKQAAIENIVTNLRLGVPVDDVDALWVSNKIYVDTVDSKHIIKKELVDGTMTLNVIKSEQDKKVVNEIESFRDAWREAKNNAHANINAQSR